MANSRCVVYVPDLVAQANTVIDLVTPDLVIPTNFVGWVIEIVTLINRYALWQKYCSFGSLFATLDNLLNAIENISVVLVRYTSHREEVHSEWNNVVQQNTNEDCFQMFKSAGRILSLLTGFNVAEDIA